MAKYLIHQATIEKPELMLENTKDLVEGIAEAVEFKVMEQRIKEIHSTEVVQRVLTSLTLMTSK